MFRKTKADRIIRERQRQINAQNLRAREEAERKKQDEHYQLLLDISAEINVVLPLLEELNFPFAEAVSITKYWLYEWITTRSVRAGWLIGHYYYDIRGDRVSSPIYLLSDGRLCTSGSNVFNEIYSVQDIGNASCLQGLKKLRQSLEELKQRQSN